MIYRDYGGSGIKVSVIGFGGMRFRNQDNVDECAALVHAAYEAGINYFDTAPGYGKSEELFGAAFREMKKTRAEKPFYVATKSGHHDPQGVRRDLETSLERMGLDYIDMYQMWCVMNGDDYKGRVANGVLKEFEKLKEEGLIRRICISTHMPGGEIGKVLEDYPFEHVLMGYSAINFNMREEGVQAAAGLGRAVVVMNPLAGGIIPQNAGRFQFLKSDPGESVVQAALRFLMNDPRITIALVGFSTPEQVQEAVDAAKGLQPMDAAAYARLRAGIVGNFNELCTGCHYCDNCPEHIPIPKLMDAYNQMLLGGKPENISGRLRWHWGLHPGNAIFQACIKCGKCDEVCTQKLPVMARVGEICDLMEAGKAVNKQG